MFVVVMRACRFVAVAGSASYVGAYVFTLIDGHSRGVEIPQDVQAIWRAICTFAALATVSRWVVQQEIKACVAEASAEVAQGVAQRLGDEINHALKLAGNRSHLMTAEVVRDAVLGPVMDEKLDAAVNRAATIGMAAGASGGRYSGGLHTGTDGHNVTRFRGRDS